MDIDQFNKKRGASLTNNSLDKSFIPQYFSFLFDPLSDSDMETIYYQYEFEQKNNTEKNKTKILAIACMKLLKSRKIWTPYFGFVATKLALATSLFKKILELEHSKDHERYREMLPAIGYVHIFNGKVKLGIEESKEFEKKYKYDPESPGSVFPLLEAKMNIAEGLLTLNNFSEVQQELEEVKSTIDYFKRHQPDLDLNYYEIMIDIFYNNVAQGVGEDLQKCLDQAEEIKQKVTEKNLDLLGLIEITLAVLYATARDQIKAQELLEHAHNIFERIGDDYLLNFAKGAMGILKLNVNDSTAIQTLEEVSNVLEQFGAANDAMQFTVILSRHYSSTNQPEKAFDILKKIDQFIEMQDYEQDSQLLLTMATTAIESDELSFAKKYIKLSESQMKRNYNVITELSLYYTICLYDIADCNLSQAEENLKKALTLAEDNNIWHYIYRSINRIIEISLNKFLIQQRKKDLFTAKEAIDDLLLMLPSKNPSRTYCLLYMAGIEFLLRNFQQMRNNLKLAKEEAIYDKTKENLTKWQDSLLDAVTTITRTEESTVIKETDLRIVLQILSALISLDVNLVNIQPELDSKSTVRSVFIISESGLPLYYNTFGEKGSDEILVSGFLAAITEFSQALSSSQEGSLQTILHANYAILLEKQMGFIFGIIVAEESYQVRLLLRRFIKALDMVLLAKIDQSSAINVDNETKVMINKKVSSIFNKETITTE